MFVLVGASNFASKNTQTWKPWCLVSHVNLHQRKPRDVMEHHLPARSGYLFYVDADDRWAFWVGDGHYWSGVQGTRLGCWCWKAFVFLVLYVFDFVGFCSVFVCFCFTGSTRVVLYYGFRATGHSLKHLLEPRLENSETDCPS